MNTDLVKIKDKYGEAMSHLCRKIFPTILEEEGLLYKTLISRFEPCKSLCEDIINNGMITEFKNYIYDLAGIEENDNARSKKSPKELLKEAGYNLYECKTENDIQSFRKYYKRNEELCTFKENRLKDYYVFFAVKENIDNIKREDFKKPRRQDEYGTSVISIQFSKGKYNDVSIKNRYNHIVNNPDSTFNNHLDNIIPGLTDSFELYYNLNIKKTLEKEFIMDGYVKADDGKLYKYNYLINNIYYCPNNIIIDNLKVNRQYKESERYIILDYFILDMKEKKIELYDERLEESFLDSLDNIDSVSVIKNGNVKTIYLKNGKNMIIIETDKLNRMIGYTNDSINAIYGYYLKNNKYLKYVSLKNVKLIKDYFLYENKQLERILMPSIEKIGNHFLYFNKKLKYIYSPKLKEVGCNFLINNRDLKNINFPNLIRADEYFITNNEIIDNAYLPKLEIVGDDFLGFNKSLQILSLPNLIKMYDYFLYNNNKLESLDLSKLEYFGNCYLWNNRVLKEVKIDDGQVYDNFICNSSFSYNFKEKQLVLK